MKREGYLFIDHSASPGLPEDLAIAVGLDPKMVAEGKIAEIATLTCSHCKCSVAISPLRKIERANCPKCGHHYICDICAFLASQPDYDHTPYEKRVDIALSGKELALGSPHKLLITS